MNLWGRLGISVAIIAVFTIVMTEVFQERAFYQSYRWVICAGLLGMGAFLFVIGKFVNARLRETRRTEEDETPADPFILVNMVYWGIMLGIFGLIVVMIIPGAKVEARTAPPPPAETNAVKKPEPPPAVTHVEPPLPPPAKPVKFPELKLQGIVIKQDTSSALINGRTYFVGDTVEGTRIISITATNALLEFQGQRRLLELPD